MLLFSTLNNNKRLCGSKHIDLHCYVAGERIDHAMDEHLDTERMNENPLAKGCFLKFVTLYC